MQKIKNCYKKNIGNNGEKRACIYLEECGYSILKRNYRIRAGEIDIIALVEDIIVFTEVKTLPNGYPELLKKILNTNKKKRIIETAKFFLSEYRQYSNNYIRFDVIIIDMPGYPPVYHLKNAFSEIL